MSASDTSEAGLHPTGPIEHFDPAVVDGLPAPARRYLLHAIAPGTVLARWADLDLTGRIRLKPDGPWMSMDGHEVLAPPAGFVWRATVSRGLMRMSGFDRYVDGHGEMAWKLWGLVPVMHGQGPDIDRSAAGRMAFEGVWMPSALLPARGAHWTAIDDQTAQVELVVDGHPHRLVVTVDDDGRLIRGVGMRVGTRHGEAREEPFGFDAVAEETTFGGYTVPSRMVVGWSPGAPDAFGFFDVVVESAIYHPS